MKYIKKNEFKKTKHNLRDNDGRLFVIESDTMENDKLYERYKFMFDVVEEKEVVKEIKIEMIEPIIDMKEKIVEIELKDEDVVETIDPIIKKDVLEELSECSTKEQIFELADENDIQLDRRKRNIKKLKDEFKDEFEVK